MPSDLTYIPLYISYGKIAQFVISDYISEQAFLGNPYYNTEQPKHIYCATQALINSYADGNPVDEALLHSLAQYQYSLYSGFIGITQKVFNGDFKTPIPPTPPTPPAQRYRFGVQGEDDIAAETRRINMQGIPLILANASNLELLNNGGNPAATIRNNYDDGQISLLSQSGQYKVVFNPYNIEIRTLDDKSVLQLQYPPMPVGALSGYTMPITVNNTPADITGNITVILNPNYEEGGVVFGDSTGNGTTDATQIYWDDTNKRLGIGTSAPNMQLTVANDVHVINGQIAVSVDGYQGVFIRPTVSDGHGSKYIEIDQPNWRIVIHHGNADVGLGGGMARSPSSIDGNSGELKIFSKDNTYKPQGGGAWVTQSWITFYTDSSLPNGSGGVTAGGEVERMALSAGGLRLPILTEADKSNLYTNNQANGYAPYLAEGNLIYNASIKKLQFYDGTGWRTITST